MSTNDALMDELMDDALDTVIGFAYCDRSLTRAEFKQAERVADALAALRMENGDEG